MTIFQEPRLSEADQAVMRLIEIQREKLRYATQTNPRRWTGSLRRLSFARAVRGSNSIEGYDASLEDAVAAIDSEPPLDPKDETTLALLGYRDALTYIMQAARDPYFDLNKQFLKSLHFMMLSHDTRKNPGQYRPGSIRVVDDKTRETVYEAPAVEHVDGLVSELIAYLRADPSGSPIVRAAMAHLNLTMIHPFSDGNGRMARALQTLVLARDGLLDPVFASIEEWLGNNTQAYYAILAATGQGGWNPNRSALEWVRFCLRAHYFQAARVIRRNEEYAAVYGAIEELIQEEGHPHRVALPLLDAALGLRLDNPRYVAATGQQAHTAGRDLKHLVKRGWLVPIGEKRGRKYERSPTLLALREAHRLPRALTDPYELVAEAPGDYAHQSGSK
jgi:Fic family protein